MKIPKKLIAGIIGAAGTAAPLIGDIVSEKMKENSEKKRQEMIYTNQKRNGFVKIASIVFSLVGLFISILAFKQSSIIIGTIGLLSVISYVITFLYCLEIIDEKKRNTYKIVFIIGDMLMVAAATFLFF